MAPSPKCLTGDVAATKQFLDSFDVFLIDCDGVLWSGTHIFEGIPETIRYLKSLGKRTVFVTNNSKKTRQALLDSMKSLGIPSELDDIFSSAYSSAIYLSRVLKLPPGKQKVFVIGESGLESELRTHGVPVIGGTDPAFRREFTPADIQGIADGSLLDPEVGAVLAGLDFGLNYLKLSIALQYLRRGAVFLVTNTDAVFTMSKAFFPGASASVAPLVVISGRQPESLGKPYKKMMDAIEAHYPIDRARTCMIGDSISSDIKFGIDNKLGGTLHVLTGIHSKEHWGGEATVEVPAYYADSLATLLQAK